MKDLALFILRMTAGAFLAGHGAQKLFGWFGGAGLRGMAGYVESLGLRPGARWALLGGGTECVGGTLTALGLFHPLGPITLMAPMAVAIGRAHRDKPIWVNAGGAELPVVYTAVGTSLLLTGPGRIALDRLFGVRVPWYITTLAAGATAGGIAYALTRPPTPAVESAAEAAQPEAGPSAESARAWQEQRERALQSAEEARATAAAVLGDPADTPGFIRSAERLTEGAGAAGILAADRPSDFGGTVQEQAIRAEQEMARYREAAARMPEAGAAGGRSQVSHVPGSEVEAADRPSDVGPMSVQTEAALSHPEEAAERGA